MGLVFRGRENLLGLTSGGTSQRRVGTLFAAARRSRKPCLRTSFRYSLAGVTPCRGGAVVFGTPHEEQQGQHGTAGLERYCVAYLRVRPVGLSKKNKGEQENHSAINCNSYEVKN